MGEIWTHPDFPPAYIYIYYKGYTPQPPNYLFNFMLFFMTPVICLAKTIFFGEQKLKDGPGGAHDIVHCGPVRFL